MSACLLVLAMGTFAAPEEIAAFWTVFQEGARYGLAGSPPNGNRSRP